MKLKLNKCIGATSNCRKFYYKKKYFHFVNKKKSSLSCWKKISPCPPNRKTNGQFLIKKIKSREHSAMPTPPGTATTF